MSNSSAESSASASTSSLPNSSTSTESSSFSSAPSSSSSSTSSASASSHSHPSRSAAWTRSESGVAIVAAEQKDLYPGNEIFVRGQPATVTHLDFPHVYWRCPEWPSDCEKHRSYNSTPHIFSVDPTKRGTIPPSGVSSPLTAAAFKAVPTLRVGQGAEEEDEEDDEDDDDDFTVQAVTAVLKPEQASKAIAHLQERRSPKTSPKGSPKHKDEGGEASPPDAD